MRILVVLLVLTPAHLWSQSRSEAEPPRDEPAAEAVSAASLSDTVPAGGAVRAERQASATERSHSAAVAQPTMSNFLYQVLLAAVTALVTALIWKAVF